MPYGILRRYWRYAWALVSVGVAALAVEFGPGILAGRGLAFVFFAAVFASTILGGTGPGYFSILLSIFVANRFFMDPRGDLVEGGNLVAELTFAVVTSVVVGTVGSRRSARRALSASEKRFRTAQDLSLDAFTVLAACRDATGRIVDFEWVYANPVAERLLGRTGLAGKRLLEVLPGNRENRDLFERYVSIVESGKAHDVELRYDADGISGWFRNVAVKLDDGVAVTFSDITERKRTEEALRESEARMRAVFNALVEGVVFLNPKGEVEEINDAVSSAHGHTLHELTDPELDPRGRIVRPDGTLFPEEEQPAIVALRTGEAVRNVEMGVPASDGTLRWRLVNAQPVRDDRGALLGAVASFYDISDIKRAEGELRALNETLEQRVRERTAALERSQEALRQSERLAAIGQVMTGLSHESRNALQRSSACLELLEKRLREQPDLCRLAAEARRAQTDLRHVYEEVQDYARPLVLYRQRTDVAAVWREAWQKLAQERQGRKAKLREDVDGVDSHCWADPAFLEQVFRNLMENALAASPGPLELRLTCREVRLGDLPALRIRVRDDGPGLSPELRERVFEPFFTTKTKGTGLGLSIVRRIVEAHGGKVELGPPLERGLEVVVDLPREEE